MEPNHNSYQPSAELPQPQAEAGSLPAPAAQEVTAAAPEQSTQPMAPPVGQQPLQSVQPMQAAQPAGQMPAQPAAPAGSTATNALIADDVDLIEKEWVVKAKAIVAQTKDDPYQQNNAMTQVKADYMKKRYNKDLKVNNEH